MDGRETFVKAALEAPDEVRQSRIDAQVLLFYKAEATKRWTCAVAKRLADSGFLITVSDRRDQRRRSSMAEVKIFHDREGQTLTV